MRSCPSLHLVRPVLFLSPIHSLWKPLNPKPYPPFPLLTPAQAYILGPNLELLPIGASGELCIAGIHVAKGYLRRKDESRRTFVSNPYGMGSHDRKLFRSGERARWLPDGTLQILGRMDEQVRLSE